MALNAPLRDWSGRTVWLIGASTGIGRATALRLHAAGARVCVSARNPTTLQTLAEAAPGLQILPLDVTDAAAVQAATRTLLARHGAIDFALYCAGHYRAMRATAFDLAEAQRHVDINYRGALHLLDALLPVLLRQAASGRGAHLSLVASVAGYRALPQALAYGPTKAALIHLAEGLYLDLHTRGIGVSVVNPGFVETRLTAANRFRMPALISPEQAAEAMLQGWAEGRFEIAFPRRFTGVLKAMRPLPDSLYFRAVSRVTGL
ncbi:SDR family NAD(P)-dependent oxidoreductase [Pseudaquabacterium rugosum]|uniref:SDR family NAD(P)-dependent oxidoreductase n=1 Tax=Pseudaquabacterium rugosum TaxID=2984194 RepID=A0ABU9B9N5_9BURK